MSSAHQISVDDIDTKMNVLVALSTRLAQQKQEAYTDAATAGGDIGTFIFIYFSTPFPIFHPAFRII